MKIAARVAPILCLGLATVSLAQAPAPAPTPPLISG